MVLKTICYFPLTFQMDVEEEGEDGDDDEDGSGGGGLTSWMQELHMSVANDDMASFKAILAKEDVRKDLEVTTKAMSCMEKNHRKFIISQKVLHSHLSYVRKFSKSFLAVCRAQTKLNARYSKSFCVASFPPLEATHEVPSHR